MTRRHCLELVVQVKSPFVFAGVEASAVGVDTPALRDECGRPVLPGDHLKGLLRQAVETIATRARAALEGIAVDWLFGPRFPLEPGLAGGVSVPGGADPYAPVRGALLLADLAANWIVLPAAAGGGRRKLAEWDAEARKGAMEKGLRHVTRIRIDQETGTVARGMLQVVELAAPLAATAEFTGEALLYADDADAAKVVRLLNRALKLVPYFGGLRSAGFGEHAATGSSVALAAPGQAGAARPAVEPPAAARIAFEGHFDRPFLVAAERAAGNVFVGSAVVPGGAIKGAVADMLMRAGLRPEEGNAVGRALACLRFGHAFPLGAGDDAGVVLGRALPLAAMYDPVAKTYECAFAAAHPGMIGTRCADFRPDWKDADAEAFANAVGRPQAELPFLPRGHTRIAADTGVATDAALYMEVARGACLADGTTPRRFRFTVDFADAVADPALRAAAAEIHRVLAGGLDSIGKTRARFIVDARSPAQPAPEAIAGRPFGDRTRWRVLLETPGILLDPFSDDDGGERPVAAGLAAYFEEVAPGARLVDHYAQRRLVGGYAALRRRPGGAGTSYRPYSLFVAGSCFLLEAGDADAAGVGRALAALVRRGLPVLRWRGAGTEPVTSWRDCAYLPENGYGAISVEDEVFDRIPRVAARDKAA